MPKLASCVAITCNLFPRTITGLLNSLFMLHRIPIKDKDDVDGTVLAKLDQILHKHQHLQSTVIMIES